MCSSGFCCIFDAFPDAFPILSFFFFFSSPCTGVQCYCEAFVMLFIAFQYTFVQEEVACCTFFLDLKHSGVNNANVNHVTYFPFIFDAKKKHRTARGVNGTLKWRFTLLSKQPIFLLYTFCILYSPFWHHVYFVIYVCFCTISYFFVSRCGEPSNFRKF